MESVLDFLKNAEQELTVKLKEMVEQSKQVHIEEAYKGIESMYDIPSLEGVKYDRCVMIPGPQGSFYCAPFKLPHGEYVIYKKEQHHRFNNQTDYNYCVAITNYGRILHTLPVWPSPFGGMTYFSPISDTTVANATHGQPPSGHAHITVCDPLPYKLPKFAFETAGLYNIQAGPSDPYAMTKFSDEYRNLHSVTKSIQEYCKEYYTLIGKWQPYINKNIEVDFDAMRQEFETQKKDIKLLESQVENLVSVNNTLESELESIKESYTTLQKEQADYKELLKFKEMIIKHLDNNLDEHRTKDGKLLSTEDIDHLLSYHHIIVDYEWKNACDALDEMEEFKKYQEMQKKFGKLGTSTTIKNTSIGIKKGR